MKLKDKYAYATSGTSGADGYAHNLLCIEDRLNTLAGEETTVRAVRISWTIGILLAFGANDPVPASVSLSLVAADATVSNYSITSHTQSDNDIFNAMFDNEYAYQHIGSIEPFQLWIENDTENRAVCYLKRNYTVPKGNFGLFRSSDQQTDEEAKTYVVAIVRNYNAASAPTYKIQTDQTIDFIASKRTLKLAEGF